MERPGVWAGWVVFAGVMMIMIGCFHALAGLVALFKDDDYTAWGWIHLLVGVVVAIAGVALFAGQMWARVIGVLLAGLSALANMAFIAAYPVWSIIIITLDVIVIFALIVHGRDVRAMT